MKIVTKGSLVSAMVGVGLLASTVGAAADEIAAVGNGGTGDGRANGGAVSIGNINSGGNTGATISLGNSTGTVDVTGPSIVNSTSFSVNANAGVAINTASGANDSIAFFNGFFLGFFDD
jgi:hypothetical protein